MTVLAFPPSPEQDDQVLPDTQKASRPSKRKRPTLLTPPISADDPETTQILDKATYILSTEATALSQVSRLYQTDPVARAGILQAVDCITRVNAAGGKLIICGVGKSGLVGMKTVATMKSLGIGCCFMHATEAVHGDLGDIKPNDAVLFITFSGRTSELLNLLPHISEETPILAITSHMQAGTCPLLAGRRNTILLPAPVHETEESTFGVCAPTTSTTVAIAIGDMLALTVADRVHGSRTSKVFKKNHPGGAIGERTATAITPVSNASPAMSVTPPPPAPDSPVELPPPAAAL
ncbi:hypothetical protein B0A49_00383 [Cryomyces minteri]|uniref:SIS domain-containing protein n=1 Tax=Cryomyces minteri TaxID=331657 RepID=A0A4U0XUU3_9PEZI|nr:hypothetical protein B0A49_02563 [Cryomyces minteri]TKA81897.1 hypothetical protein B0A49_00383 [Cryomyces minteri]